MSLSTVAEITFWRNNDCMLSGQSSLQWRHNGRDGVSNHRRLDCPFHRLFRRRSKKTSNLRVTGLCEGNSPVTGEFPSQRASNADNVSIWWRHHVSCDSWEWHLNQGQVGTQNLGQTFRTISSQTELNWSSCVRLPWKVTRTSQTFDQRLWSGTPIMSLPCESNFFLYCDRLVPCLLWHVVPSSCP